MGLVSEIMTYSVYQHWDPLKVCVVGRSYPPEFYSWITVPHVRELFEKIAIETEEDYQNIIKKLQEFGVEVLRPNIPSRDDCFINRRYIPPPMTPRDLAIMIGDTYHESYTFDFYNFYQDVKDSTWPDCDSLEEFYHLPKHIQQECINLHGLQKLINLDLRYRHIDEYIKQQGNLIKRNQLSMVNGAMVSRIGQDLYFGTERYQDDQLQLKHVLDQEFSDTRNHIVNTGGHGDGTYCPVAPGLIISLYDVPNYSDTFPGWEVVYLPGQSWHAVEPFLELKEKNQGKWWIPGFEKDQSVIDVVETWMGHWTGYVEETVFDVNMLIIDPKNVMVFGYNKQVFDALNRYGMTPHIVPFRHRYFWDGGIHCVTSDLHRSGTMQDFFPHRNNAR
jgi:hypothetical protein